MRFRSRLGAVLLCSLMLAYEGLVGHGPREAVESCVNAFGFRDLRRGGESLPLVLCGGSPRWRARALLRRLDDPCLERLGSPLWLDAGDVLEVGRGCRLRRRRLSASRRLALGLRLEINGASQEELEALPRIGPALARRIVRHRRRRGPFGSVEALTQVRGIGPRTVATVRPYLRCGGAAKNARKD